MTIPNEETIQSQAMSQDDLELARRLAAACIAHRAGFKSIDYARKTYVDSSKPIGDGWIELARIAKARMDRMMQNIGDIPPIMTRTQ
ncbi:MAG: hypothetical protein WBM24_03525 [Candidatus Sulfotelmatobacter sp.]